ncbi:MAG: cytidylate kinase-like family protein [Candidatus Zixiibacteriota bacterium]|nr:MAG: cytidylate kinase-like family protein [candidate division Zixibacteria bacterium]
MAIITISRGTFSGGRELAGRLSEKLGYSYISREDLSEKAIKMGVPVGKLQMAMVRPPGVYKRMARERDQYLACMTMLLCEQILERNVVYQGHTGHMLLPGVPNILRIRVLADLEFRIRRIMQDMKLNRKKAKKYITNVDADRDKWVRFLYGVDWHDPFNYDFVINLDQASVGNVASGLCAMAELPDFQLTPAAKKAINNLHLASRAHFTLMADSRTNFADVKVTANDGVVQVTYLPQQSDVAPYVQEVLSAVKEIKAVHTTIAQSSILYVQDKFDYDSTGFSDVIKVARKWDAAVELMSMAGGEGYDGEAKYIAEQAPRDSATADKDDAYDGGIKDDAPPVESVDQNIARCLDELMKHGCSGGSSIFYGKPDALLSALQRRTSYSMIVLGDLFLDKGASIRIRLRREMKSLLADNLTVPVIEETEIHEKLEFGWKQILKLAIFLVIATAIFAGCFIYEGPLISFLTGEEYKHLRILAVLFVVGLTPLFAYTYGSFARQILRLFNID